MRQTHILTVKNSDIIYQVEARTFKFGKARDNGQADKLINNVKLTDLDYDRSMVYQWIDIAVSNIRSAFVKYACMVQQSFETGHDNDDDYKITMLYFNLSEKWCHCNGDGFDHDCIEYVVNYVISEFLGLSLPREAELYAAKAMQALKNAERKLFFKKA